VLSRLGPSHVVVCAAGLLGLGLVMVYSASAIRSGIEFGSSGVYVWRQLGGLALGLAAAAAVSRTPIERVRAFAPVAWGGGVLLVLLTLTPLGVSWNGAQRWLALGPLTFQPLELAKLGVVLGVAWWLARNQYQLHDPRVSLAGPALIAGLPALLLMLQPDFGGALMLLVFAGVLVFAAGARLRHLAACGLALLPFAVMAAAARDYRVSRLSAWLDPWADRLGEGYQLVQSLIAFGSGGWTGSGLGAGQQKLGYLPEAHTDFILSIVGEELGLLGVALTLAAYALLGLATIGVASRARDLFALLVALGASLMLWLQGVVNAGVAMGMLPTKGTTLPLVSYGRSSLVASLIALGLVLAVARPTRRGRTGWRS
jgi:cell division protein FtsW